MSDLTDAQWALIAICGWSLVAMIVDVFFGLKTRVEVKQLASATAAALTSHRNELDELKIEIDLVKGEKK